MAGAMAGDNPRACCPAALTSRCPNSTLLWFLEDPVGPGYLHLRHPLQKEMSRLMAPTAFAAAIAEFKERNGNFDNE